MCIRIWFPILFQKGKFNFLNWVIEKWKTWFGNNCHNFISFLLIKTDNSIGLSLEKFEFDL